MLLFNLNHEGEVEKMDEEKRRRYARVVERYRKRFGEVPPELMHAGEAVELYLDLMEEALAGRRGRITGADLGYPPGSDI